MDKKQKDCLTRYVIWLNHGGAAAEDFRKLTDFVLAMARDKTPARDRYKASLAWARKTSRISQRLAEKYPTWREPVLSPKPGGMPFSAINMRFQERSRQHDLGACVARGHFEEILAAGLVLNIGRCKVETCRRYFWGKVGKFFCSDKCLRKEMRQTPSYKKNNAEHQRKHYDKYFRKKPRGRGRVSKQTRRRKSR